MADYHINQEKTKAVFFDLNGTLVRDGQLHHRAFESIFAEYGIHLSPQEYEAKVANHLNREIWPAIFNEDSEEKDFESLAAVKEKQYRVLLGREAITTPGAAELIENLHGNQITIGLVTSAPKNLSLDILKLLGLSQVFNIIITGDNVAHGKPNPEGYILALQKAGVNAEQALVFEDSPQGVMAATTARIPTIGVLPEYKSDQLIQAGAIHCVNDFREVIVTSATN